MIAWAAPGKAVLWGEYAVLAGAPAVVMAVDRYARASIRRGGRDWRLSGQGFTDDARMSVTELCERTPQELEGIAALVRAVVASLGDPALPPDLEIHTDTQPFYRDGHKLGIGSSAAICTALTAAFADFLGQPFSEQQALDAHRHLQGPAGSGLDVAAACRGGLIRFRQGSSSPASWPDSLLFRFFWTGHATRTSGRLARFNRWRADGNTQALTALCEAAETVTHSRSDA